MATVAEIWRYPVKSMQGERIDAAHVTDAGLAGDRGYVVVDPALGKPGSAKHPRLWGDLLHVGARYVDEPTAGAPLPPVALTLPDGTTTTSEAPDVDDHLSKYLGREVHLTTQPPDDNAYLAVWPEFEGVMPDNVRADAAVAADDRTAAEPGEGTLAQHAMSLGAPAGTFFDVSALHLLTTATLARLNELAPDSTFETRRYRPNIVIDTGGDADPFAENEWTGKAITIGSTGLSAFVIMPTMRCIMTTLSQPGLPRDNDVLRTVAAHNRVDMGGMGTWSCVGAYATVASGGSVATGDDVSL